MGVRDRVGELLIARVRRARCRCPQPRCGRRSARPRNGIGSERARAAPDRGAQLAGVLAQSRLLRRAPPRHRSVPPSVPRPSTPRSVNRPHIASTGAPCQRVPAGSSSPRSTTECPDTSAGPEFVSGSTPRSAPGWRRDRCRADAQQPVVEDVGHQAGAAIDRAAVRELDHVVLGDRGRLTPHAAADLAAHRAQVERHQRRADRKAQQPLAGELLVSGVDQLVAPDEERPQRVPRAVAADHVHFRATAIAATARRNRAPAAGRERWPRRVPGARRASQRPGGRAADRQRDRVGDEDPDRIHRPRASYEPPRRIGRAGRVGASGDARQLERGHPEPGSSRRRPRGASVSTPNRLSSPTACPPAAPSRVRGSVRSPISIGSTRSQPPRGRTPQKPTSSVPWLSSPKETSGFSPVVTEISVRRPTGCPSAATSRACRARRTAGTAARSSSA